MPNWCQNNLRINKSARVFVEKFTTTDDQGNLYFDLEKILPTPADLLQGDGWYDWRITHWGPKWNTHSNFACEVESELAYDSFSISFDSAWTPPIEALRLMAENDPEIFFEMYYYEPGCFFAGWICNNVAGFSEHYYEDSETVQKIGSEEFGDIFSDCD